MHQDAERILFTEAEIARRVRELGQKITQDYAQLESLMVVGILKGATVFMSDLIREINLPIQIDYMVASSYGNSSCSSQNIIVKKDISAPITGKHILLVEDIIDTGYTMQFLFDYLGQRNPASLQVCSLLDKPSRRLVPVEIKYTGFVVEDHFIIGYGMDYAEKYRNLKNIQILKPEIYS